MVRLETKVLLVIKVQPETKVHKGCLETKVQQVTRALLVIKVHRVQSVL
jgi:hypothetical protein